MKLLLFLLVSCVWICPAFAEENPAELEATQEAQIPENEELSGTDLDSEVPIDLESDYTFGTVSKISAQEIVIREFDDEKGEEIENVYQIPSEIEWENVQNWQEIAVGDYAEIDYTVADGKRTASFVSIESMKEGQ